MNGDLPYFHGASDGTKKFAKKLRHNSTPAEDLFWKMASNRKTLTLKIRRQHPIGKYIADFYCHELKLVIEIDGSIHDLEHIKQKDLIRDQFMKDEGLHILRFSNEDVFSNPHLIEEALKTFIVAP